VLSPHHRLSDRYKKAAEKQAVLCTHFMAPQSTLCICGYSFDSFSIFRKIIGLISQRGSATGFSPAVLFYNRTFFSFLCEALRLFTRFASTASSSQPMSLTLNEPGFLQ